MRFAALALPLLALAGAAAAKPLFPQGTALPPPDDLAPSRCQAGPAQAFVGQKGVDVADRARAASDSEIVRLIRPGQPVTQDLRSDRLNLELDADGLVAKARCG